MEVPIAWLLWHHGSCSSAQKPSQKTVFDKLTPQTVVIHYCNGKIQRQSHLTCLLLVRRLAVAPALDLDVSAPVLLFDQPPVVKSREK